MGLFGFGKKNKEPDFSSGQPQGNLGASLDRSMDINSGLGLEGLNNQQEPQQFDPFGNPRPKLNYEQSDLGFSRMNQGPAGQGDLSKDIQIIIAKLDAIKAEVNNINHRLDMLENENKQSQQQKRYQW